MPPKQLSIPRLGLCVALTGAQLLNLLQIVLNLHIRMATLWSDSTTVLYWLLSDSCRYKVFVGTRVAEIQDLTKSQGWRYVDSQNNPADDLTRGKSLSDLAQPCRWNQGPAFLLQSPDLWPTSLAIGQPEEPMELRKPSFCGGVFPGPDPPIPDPSQFVTFQDLLDCSAASCYGATDPPATPSRLGPTADGGGGGGSGEVRADLGSHKPVRVGKRRPESTASIRSSNNPVTVIDYANSNPNHNPNTTNANGVDSARLLPPRTGL